MVVVAKGPNPPPPTVVVVLVVVGRRGLLLLVVLVVVAVVVGAELKAKGAGAGGAVVLYVCMYVCMYVCNKRQEREKCDDTIHHPSIHTYIHT